MAASGYTPISLYYSTTAAAAPVAGNLVNGELAINITDGKLYYKNNAGVVKVIAGTGGTGVVAGSNTQVQYNNNGVFGASSNLTFNGTTLTANTLNLTNQLTTAYGGTGLTSYTAGDLPYYATGTALSKLGIGTANQILTSSGTAPQWTTLSGVAVTTISFSTTGLTPATATSGAVTVGGTLVTSHGGTGLTSYTAGDMTYFTSGTALSKLNIGTSGQILTSTGTAPQWTTLSGVAVTSLSFGTTGLTPATTSTGAITVGGTLITSNGGTGLSSYTAGDLLYYSTGTTLSKLGIGTANYVLTSSGSAPQWVAATSVVVGAAGSNTQIQFNNSGVLGAEAGLTWASSTLTASNITTGGSLTLSGGTANSVVYLNASKVATTTSTFSYTATGLGVGTSLPLGKLHVVGGNSNNIIADNNGEQYTTVQWYNNGVEKAQQYWDQTNSLFVSGTDVSAAYVFKTNTTERMRIAGSTGNVSIGTASTPIKFLVNGTDAVGLPVGTTLQRPTGAAGYVRFNSDTTEFEGYNGTAWASIGGSAISNDTTTATARYPLFAAATSGTALTVYTSNAKYLYTPSTGTLQSPQVAASNGFFVNPQTISTSYTLAATDNAGSFGPISVADGVTVTVSDGATWTVV